MNTKKQAKEIASNYPLKPFDGIIDEAEEIKYSAADFVDRVKEGIGNIREAGPQGVKEALVDDVQSLVQLSTEKVGSVVQEITDRVQDIPHRVDTVRNVFGGVLEGRYDVLDDIVRPLAEPVIDKVHGTAERVRDAVQNIETLDPRDIGYNLLRTRPGKKVGAVIETLLEWKEDPRAPVDELHKSLSDRRAAAQIARYTLDQFTTEQGREDAAAILEYTTRHFNRADNRIEALSAVAHTLKLYRSSQDSESFKVIHGALAHGWSHNGPTESVLQLAQAYVHSPLLAALGEATARVNDCRHHIDMDEWAKTMTFYHNSPAAEFVMHLITPYSEYDYSCNRDKITDAFSYLEKRTNRAEGYEPKSHVVRMEHEKFPWRDLAPRLAALRQYSVKGVFEAYLDKENGPEVLWHLTESLDFLSTIGRNRYASTEDAVEMLDAVAQVQHMYEGHPLEERVAAQISRSINLLGGDSSHIAEYCRRRGFPVPTLVDHPDAYFDVDEKARADKEVMALTKAADYKIKTLVARSFMQLTVVEAINKYEDNPLAIALLGNIAQRTRDLDTVAQVATFLTVKHGTEATDLKEVARYINPKSGYEEPEKVSARVINALNGGVTYGS